MKPLNDDELNEFLKTWEAPNAPVRLQPPTEPRAPWWRWWLTGIIHVPVPVGLLAAVILVLSVYWAVSARQSMDRPRRTVTLADFEPVKQLQPRIIRSGYEDK